MNKLLIIFILFFCQKTYAQNCVISGYIKSLTDSSVIPIANIDLLEMNNKIVGNATSDFEGRYLIKVTLNKDAYYQIRAKYNCYYDTFITKIKLSNSNNVDIFFRPIKCKETNSKECPQLSDSCKVISIIYIFPGYNISRKEIKAQEKGEVIYRDIKFNEANCCPHKWYCKTHRTGF